MPPTDRHRRRRAARRMGTAGRSESRDATGANGACRRSGRRRAEQPAGVSAPPASASARLQRYLAEGVQNDFFSTRIALVNPSASIAANVQVRFAGPADADGAVVTREHWLTLAPLRRATVEAASIAGLAARLPPPSKPTRWWSSIGRSPGMAAVTAATASRRPKRHAPPGISPRARRWAGSTRSICC